jgi:hypothetical protein
LAAQTAGAIPAGAYPTGTPAAANLFGRMVASRDLDRRHFTRPTSLWRGKRGPGKMTPRTSQQKARVRFGKQQVIQLAEIPRTLEACRHKRVTGY